MKQKWHYKGAAALILLVLLLVGGIWQGWMLTQKQAPPAIARPLVTERLQLLTAEMPNVDVLAAENIINEEVWQEQVAQPAKQEQMVGELHCTISISCATVLANWADLAEEKRPIVPADGVLLAAEEVAFTAGESVFDVLLRQTQAQKIHLEFTNTPLYQSSYIEGIGNLYEFDCGDLSGWMYRVNGWFPNYGCNRYLLEDGDVIEWLYTCDLGRDIGDNSMEEAK